jgi:hypothetical protein
MRGKRVRDMLRALDKLVNSEERDTEVAVAVAVAVGLAFDVAAARARFARAGELR